VSATSQGNDQSVRLGHLRALAEQCSYIYNDAAEAALSGRLPCPRYAMLTSEGSSESTYRDNPDLRVYETADEMGAAAASSLDDGWPPRVMLDLDTGRECGYTTTVTVQPL
jgi:hypothetical protein